jgi:hypothetical protein
LKKARQELKKDLQTLLKESPKYNPENNTFNGVPFGTLALEQLLQNSELANLLNIGDNV